MPPISIQNLSQKVKVIGQVFPIPNQTLSFVDGRLTDQGQPITIPKRTVQVLPLHVTIPVHHVKIPGVNGQEHQITVPSFDIDIPTRFFSLPERSLPVSDLQFTVPPETEFGDGASTTDVPVEARSVQLPIQPVTVPGTSLTIPAKEVSTYIIPSCIFTIPSQSVTLTETLSIPELTLPISRPDLELTSESVLNLSLPEFSSTVATLEAETVTSVETDASLTSSEEATSLSDYFSAVSGGAGAVSSVLGVLATLRSYLDELQEENEHYLTLQRTLRHLDFFLKSTSDYWVQLCIENAKDDIEELSELIQQAKDALSERNHFCACWTNRSRPSCEYFNEQIAALSKVILDGFSPISPSEKAFIAVWNSALKEKEGEADTVAIIFAQEFNVNKDAVLRHMENAEIISSSGKVSCAAFYDSIRRAPMPLQDYFTSLVQ